MNSAGAAHAALAAAILIQAIRDYAGQPELVQHFADSEWAEGLCYLAGINARDYRARIGKVDIRGLKVRSGRRKSDRLPT